MRFSRFLSGMAAVSLLAACFRTQAEEVTTITLDYLTGAQAVALAKPYLSKDGQASTSADMLNTISVRDHRENVRRIRNLIGERDASPQNVSLHFQVVRGTATGSVDPALEKVGNALRELLRFEGYQLVAQTVVSASERRVVEQSINVGGLALQLGIRINDVLNDGVDMEVDLRRPGVSSLLTTNIVLPMDQTVVLGSAYPGGNGDALILTVRGEMGSTKLRTSSRRSHREGHGEGDAEAEAVAAGADLVEAAEAAAAAGAAVAAQEAQLDAVNRQLEMMKEQEVIAHVRGREVHVAVPVPAVGVVYSPSRASTPPPTRSKAGSGARPPGGAR